MVPTKGICYIERSEKNWARRLEASEAFEKLLNSTLMPMDPEKIKSLLVLIEWVARNVPVYVAGVNMNPEAADVVYEAMARL
jgi:cytochrome c